MNIFDQYFTMQDLLALTETKTAFYIGLTGTAIGAVYILRCYMQGGQYRKKTSAEGKVVIVTGSNTGIGKETVLDLAQRGAHVYMACRDMKKCQEARDEIVLRTQNQHVYCRKLDLSSLESIRKFADGFKKEEARLDILINNAGVYNCPYSLTEDGFEMQFGVNHIGHFLLTNLLLDHLKKSSPSRIINVSSLGHNFGKINVSDLNSEISYNGSAAYCQSKLANVLFTRELAKRLEGTGVTANSLHPGLVETDVFRHTGFSNNFIFSAYMRPLTWPIFKTVKSGAQTTIYAALDPDLEKVSGLYFSDCKPKEVAPAAKDDDMAKWLWSESEKYTQISAK